ncbi:MAG: KEOPS complex subunit Pcc1 [Halobacteriaceae archaeon]
MRATVRTPADEPGVLARALRPDNTADMETRVEGDAIVTEVSRDDTAGLRATLDDYTVNLTVANEVAQTAQRHTTHQ